MNQFFEALANMPPEQLATVIVATITGILAPLITVIVLVVRWLIKRQDRKLEAQALARNQTLKEQADKHALEVESVRRDIELKFKEQEAESQRLDRLFNLFEKHVDKSDKIAQAVLEGQKAHAQESEKYSNAIKNVGDILEVQVSRFQVLDENVAKVAETVSEFKGVKAEIAQHRQKVDELISSLENKLSGKAQKSDMDSLRTTINEGYGNIEKRLDGMMSEIKALKIKPIIEPIEKEKESS